MSGVSAATLSVDGADGSIFYFQAPFSLQRADLDGQGAVELLTYPFGFEVMDVNIAEARVYWLNSFNGQLVSANYDGSSPDVVGGQFSPQALALTCWGSSPIALSMLLESLFGRSSMATMR